MDRKSWWQAVARGVSLGLATVAFLFILGNRYQSAVMMMLWAIYMEMIAR